MESAKSSISNMIKALGETNYNEIYVKMTKSFNMELFNVMIKLI